MKKIPTQVSEIKAKVITEWSNPNCKFQPGQRVRFRDGYSSQVNANSGLIQRGLNKINAQGIVVARTNRRASRSELNKIANVDIFLERMTIGAINRYYVQFENGMIFGFDAAYLEKVPFLVEL